MPRQRDPIVAIVGRPNVGKSTLFNRIVGQRQALVHDQPGLTRDRHYGRAQYQNRRFTVIDTGGYEDTTDSPLLRLMREQTLIAIDEADRIVFVTEAPVPNDPIDAEILQRLRESGKPFHLAVNKCDDETRFSQAIADFSVYGLDQVYPVSATHGDGVFDLLDDLTEGFPTDELKDDRKGPIGVAIVGRQNVGKSTLTNRLLGENRVIAYDMPGTTRDAIDTPVRVEGQEYTLIDTAGIRRRGKVERGPEKLSVHSSFAAIDRCDVAVVILDATEGITTQDTHIAGYVLEAGKACILVLNKWDAVKNREEYGKYIKDVRDRFNFLKWAPILTISARTGQRAYKLWALIRHCAEQYRRDFRTADLNRVLKQATAYMSPPVTGGKGLKIKYVTQTGHCPPVITFFVNDPKLLHFSYERFLQNQYRMHLGVDGTPLRFRWRAKAENIFADPDIRDARRERQLAAQAAAQDEDANDLYPLEWEDSPDDFEAEWFQEDDVEADEGEDE